MCWCNPNIRTPQCRSINCIPPKQAPIIESPFKTPQPDMSEKELAIAILQGAGILDKDGNLVEAYR